jgi:hypothetical protein
MTEDYSTFGTAQRPNTAVITRANGQKEYIQDKKVVATGTPIKQTDNNSVLVAYESPEDQKSYFYRGVYPGYLVSTIQTPITDQNKKLVGYQDPNTKQSVSLEKQRELITISKTQQQQTITPQNNNLIKSYTKPPEEVFKSQQQTFLNAPFFNKFVTKQENIKGMDFFFPLNTAYAIGERSRALEVGLYSGIREKPEVFGKNLLIGGAVGGGIVLLEGFGSATGTLPAIQPIIDRSGLLLGASYFGNMYSVGQTKPLKERYEYYGETFGTEVIPFGLGFGAVEGFKQPFKEAINVKREQLFDYQMEKSYFKKVDPNFQFNRDLGGEAFYEYKWNELKTTTQTQLKPKQLNTEYDFINAPIKSEATLKTTNINEKQILLNPLEEAPRTQPPIKIKISETQRQLNFFGNKKGGVYISPFNLLLGEREGLSWKNDFIGGSSASESNFNIFKERNIIKNKFVPDLTKTPDLNTKNLNDFNFISIPFNSLINNFKGGIGIQSQPKSLFTYDFLPLNYANSRSEIKVDFGAISQEKTKTQTQPENLGKYGAFSLSGGSSNYQALENTQSISIPFFMPSATPFSIPNTFNRAKPQPKIIEENNRFFAPAIWEMPNFTPRAVRVRSNQDFSFKIQPIKLDIIPFADLFSVNLTESITGHKATHPKITKRSKREYSEFIRFGEQIFPTEEMRTGQVKLFRIDL